MASNGELVRDTIENFMFVQKVMLLVKKEDSMEAYALLKSKYIVYKATLEALGVNLENLDLIKEF